MANTFNLGNGNWAQKTEKLLAYNAENDNYKPLPFDFDRASTATRVNKQGLIETVGTDEPRIDFLNNTKGHLLLEPSRANYLTNSDNGSTYSVFSATKTLDEQISPDGTLNSFTLTGNGDYNQILGQTPFFTLPSAGNYTFSAFAKKGNNNFIQLFFDGFSGASNIQAYFDLENGTTPTSGASIKNYGNGWYRCSFVGTVVSGDLYGKLGFRVSYGSTNFFFNNENDTIGKNAYFYGFQLEQGSYATSYIPTSGSAVTRSAESDEQTPPDGVIGQTEGTVYVEFDYLNSTGERRFIFQLGTGNDTIYARIESGQTLTSQILNSGSGLTSTGTSVPSANNKLAIAYASNDAVIYLNGTQIAVTSSITIPSLSDIYIGNNSSKTQQIAGTVKDFKLYNTRLSNSELQALTS